MFLEVVYTVDRMLYKTDRHEIMYFDFEVLKKSALARIDFVEVKQVGRHHEFVYSPIGDARAQE